MITPETPSWNALQRHQRRISSVSLRHLFEENKSRFCQFSILFPDLLVDFSKNRVTNETLDLLFKLATETNLEKSRDDMFTGEKINKTEDRSALHVALRQCTKNPQSKVVAKSLKKMDQFTQRIQQGDWKGISGEKIKNVVNIGIGGSRLGPEMAINALENFHQFDLGIHFVSNIDGHDLQRTLNTLNPNTTLFIITSKTFSTQETIRNANSAKSWIIKYLGKSAVSSHFIAVSENKLAPQKFGIEHQNIFPLWDWVGGRYSIWSTVSISVALKIGMQNFRQFLLGGYEMDMHFRDKPMPKNLPIILALVGIWNINLENINNHLILPYDNRLKKFPAFIQQLDMESNGKSISLDGHAIPHKTGPIIFGGSGTDSQHTFFQSMHQGSNPTSSDFILVSNPDHSINDHHEELLANALGQARALMQGRTIEETNGNLHRVFCGNHPSNTILIRKLDPISLGRLIALYEHKVFVQGIIWGINSFDQWGVELGKQMAEDLLKGLKSSKLSSSLDSSSAGILNQIQDWQR